jgi:hypothetical protein
MNIRHIDARTGVLLACLLAGGSSRATLPSLPVVDTARFLPAVRQRIEAAFAEAKAKPADSGANRQLGMVLHANDQFAAARVCYERASILDSKRFDGFITLVSPSVSTGRAQRPRSRWDVL